MPLTVEGGAAVQRDRQGFRVVWADQRRRIGGGPDVDDLYTNVWLVTDGALEKINGDPLVLNPPGRRSRNPVMAADPAGGVMLLFDELAAAGNTLRARSLAPQPNLDAGPGNFGVARGALAPQLRTTSLVHDGTTFVAGWRLAASPALGFQRLDHGGLIGDAGLERALPAVPTGGPFLAGERTPVTIASNWDLAPTVRLSLLPTGLEVPSLAGQGAGRVVGLVANGPSDATVLLETDAGLLSDFDLPTLVYATGISPGQRLPTQRAGVRALALVHQPNGWTLTTIDPGAVGSVMSAWPRLNDGGTLTPLALAGDGGLGAVALEAQQDVLFLRRIVPDGGFAFAPGPAATRVSQTVALQRDPSLVWSEAADAFLLAFNQYTPERRWETLVASIALDGTTSPPRAVGGLSPAVNPTRPRLLRRPSGPGLALLLDVTSTSSALFPLTPSDGGFDVGAALGLTLPNVAGGALGDTSAVLWDQASSVVTGGGTLTRLWVAPSCAAFANGAHWLFGFDRADGGLVQVRVMDSATPSFLTRTVENLTGSTPVCATTAAQGQTLVGVYEADGGAIALFGVGTAIMGDTVPLRGFFAFDGGAGATKPKVVEFGTDTFLVGWETTPEGVSVAVVSDAGVETVRLDGRRALDARNLALATSPSGVAAVAWQEFDPANALSTLVRVRLVSPSSGRDGGVDGGSDAGAGGSDGGPGADGGADAGADAPDAGQDVVPRLVPVSCGCAGGPGAGALLLAAWLLGRRRRRIHLSAGPS